MKHRPDLAEMRKPGATRNSSTAKENDIALISLGQQV
jgi:hypothetical protein